MATVIKPIKLGVNIDHIATLRQARLTPYPNPVKAAAIITRAGADSITVHLREDKRHIQDDDVIRLKEELRLPLNLEMAVTEGMLRFAEQVQPAYCCLVPEKRDELTTEGGLDVTGQGERIRAAVARLQQAGCQVSLFIDADEQQIDSAAMTGTDMIELHTGPYAEASTPAGRKAELSKIATATDHAISCRLQVNAGHGLNYDNVQPIATLPALAELNIGHAIIARAVFTGLENAVRTMHKLMSTARTGNGHGE